MATPYKFTTAGSTNLQNVRAGQTAKLHGIVAVNTAAYEIFVKLYWFVPVGGAIAPTVGTTIPNLTFAVPALGTTTGALLYDSNVGVTANGQLWVAVTKLAADNDTTNVGAGDGIVTLIIS
jgi:hypothetical protein